MEHPSDKQALRRPFVDGEWNRCVRGIGVSTADVVVGTLALVLLAAAFVVFDSPWRWMSTLSLPLAALHALLTPRQPERPFEGALDPQELADAELDRLQSERIERAARAADRVGQPF